MLFASKVRMKISQGPNDEGLSRHHVIREVEPSLRRLRTDVIDILYLHEWDAPARAGAPTSVVRSSRRVALHAA